MRSSTGDRRGITPVRALSGFLAFIAISVLWLAPCSAPSSAVVAEVAEGSRVDRSLPLVDAGGAWGMPAYGDARRPQVAVAGDVYIQFDPSAPTVAKDSIFTINIQIAAGAQEVDTAEVHIDFDPLYLQVVDAGGSPASTIEGSGVFPVELRNSADNVTGEIDYAAGTFGALPSGTFDLATIRFKALWGTGGGSTPLTYVHQLPRKTDARRTRTMEAHQFWQRRWMAT